MAGAPPFLHPSPDKSALQEMVLGYEAITRDPVRRPGKRNLVASSYRLHGPDFLDRVRILFIEIGSATNLLGILRTTAPEIFDARDADQVQRESPSPPRPVTDVLVHPTVTRVKSAPFDPTSTRRYDLDPWKPNEGGLFDQSELGEPPARSPTGRALDPMIMVPPAGRPLRADDPSVRQESRDHPGQDQERDVKDEVPTGLASKPNGIAAELDELCPPGRPTPHGGGQTESRNQHEPKYDHKVDADPTEDDGHAQQPGHRDPIDHQERHPTTVADHRQRARGAW